MAKDVEIGIKVSGIAAIKKELKDLKGELVNATDPADIERLSKAAGQLSDKIADTNEKIKVFAAGSKFENVANGLGLVGSQLASLDFEGASESARLLTNTIKSMNPKDVAQGFKDFTKTIGQLGNAFLQMGLKLLANPLFLLVAVITGVVVAIVLLRDKLKIAEQAFDLVMKPIKILIQGLKDLTDWLGLTSFAMEENADKTIAANNKKIASNEKVTASVNKEYSFQIALAKANGEDVTELQIKQLQFDESQAKKRQKIASDTIGKIDELEKKGKGKLTEDQIKARNEATAEYVKERDAATAANQARIVLRAETNTKLREENKKAGEKSKDDQAKIDKAAEDAAKRHLAIIRGLRDLELANMEEGLQKDLALNQEKYKRDLEDLKTNKDMTQQERDKYAAEYLKRKEIEDNKAYKTESDRLKENKKKRLDEEKKFNDDLKAIREGYNDFVLEQTGTPFEKEMAAIAKKYKDEQAELDKFYEGKLDLQAEYKLKSQNLTTLQFNEQDAARKKNNEKEIFDDAEKFITKFQKITEFGTSLNGLLNQLDSNRLNSIKVNQTEELNSITEKQNKELSNSSLSETQKQAINDKYAKLKYAAELKAFQQTEAIKKKQFARDKALRIAQTVIDTASNVITSIRNNGGVPFGIPAGILAGALGAIQIATIASQKYQGEAGPSAPSIGGAAGGASSTGQSEALTPSFALTGQRNIGSTASSAENNNSDKTQQISVVAIVSETEVTNVQKRANRIRQSAEL